MANKTSSRICLVTSILLLFALCTSTMGKTIYVDDDAAGANEGSSWLNAYKYLQDALADANSAQKPVEIRVAQGIYKPDQGKNQTLGNREATFQLINGVTLKGGYAGLGEPDPNARDIELYETILTGDLNGDDAQVLELLDLLYEPTRAENSYHVVAGICTDDTTVLDGFNITAGNANGPESADPNSNGAGMYNFQSSPMVINCVFTGNSARWSGAGMHNIFSSPVVINCIFNKNSAGTSSGGHGGGMYNNSDSNPILTNCRFSSNWAGQGGGIDALCCAPIANSCKFTNNSANFGGGVQYSNSIGPKFFGCTFSGNSAHRGAAARFIKSSPILTNCLFAGNSANYGGAIAFTNMSTPTLANCTFAANTAPQGCSLACEHVLYGPSIVDINNSIFWNGGNEIWNKDGSTITVTYSDVQAVQASAYDPCEAVIWGEGNIDIDPLFASPGYWANVNDPNIAVDPNDPNAVWVDGDYHLKSQAGRWDPNSKSWVKDDVTSPCIDAGDPNSDWSKEPWPHGERINMGAYGGTAEASMSLSEAGKVIYIQWLGHASVKIWAGDVVVYVDPRNLTISLHDATLVLVTHTHSDHYQTADIARVSGPETKFIAPPDVVTQYGKGQAIAPGQTIQFDPPQRVSVTAVPAYNTSKPNHPKSNNWVGFIVELAGRCIYVAGDTDLIPEMQTLGKIDVAFLPISPAYTMGPDEAAQATMYIMPQLAVPYHWGTSTLADAQRFAQKAYCNVKIMSVGETLSSQDWLKDFSLIAHWELDETTGIVAHNSAGDKDGTLNGNPVWQPQGGKIAGALQFDGTDDYVSTPFILDPAAGAFSVFAWVKGGAAGQVIISQAGGANWLLADPSEGKLMTSLAAPAGRFPPKTLASQFVITDGQWHHIGLTWDGKNRILYVDDVEVAKDTQSGLASSQGGLYFGAGKGLEAGSFWNGLIDDIRIYSRAVRP